MVMILVSISTAQQLFWLAGRETGILQQQGMGCSCCTCEVVFHACQYEHLQILEAFDKQHTCTLRGWTVHAG